MVEPEIRDAIIVTANVELRPIKYSNLKYERKTPKYKIIEKIVKINSINFVSICSNGF